MKTNLLPKGLKIAFLALLLPLTGVNAQNLTLVETRPDAMTVCMGNYPFSLKIKNNTGSAVSSMQLRLDLPDYIQYTGNLDNASEWNTSNLNEPVFSIPQIAAHDSVTISYTAEASCGIISTISNNLTVQNKYGYTCQINGNTINQAASPFQSYNLLYANLSLNVANPLNATLNNGQRINQTSAQYRTIEVTNGGNGAIDTVIIRITPEPEITYYGFVSGFDFTTTYGFTQVVNDIFITLSGTALQQATNQSGNNDLLFDPGETIRLIEDFTVTQCASGNTLYKVQWGCNAAICNAVTSAGNGTATSNINVHSGNAQFDLFTGSLAGQLGYCENDGTMEFYFVNTGSNTSDFASDLQVDILSYEEQVNYILPLAFELFDYKVNGVSLNSSFITAQNAINWHYPKNSTTTPGYHIDFTANTTPGMLADLDGDGFYDDLAAGDTLKITVKVRFPDLTEFDTECPLDILHNYGLPQIQWLTSCGEPRTSIDGNNYYQNRYLAYNYADKQTLVDLINEPVDFVEGTPETFTFCTGSWYSNWTILDCPVDQYQGIINLPNGYHLNNPNATWFSSAGDSISYTAVEMGSQIIINGGGQSNISNQQNTWTGCFDVELILACPAYGGIDSQSDISWELQYKCNDCDIFQRRVCASESVHNHINNCPGTESSCRGIYSTDFEMTRTTLGWTDASRTEHVNDTTAGIRLDAAYAYDELQSSTSGFVSDTDFDNVFAELMYTSTVEHFTFTDGMFAIYNNGMLVDSCAANAPLLTIVANSYSYLFPMPCADMLNPGDSVVLLANWVVNNTPMINKTREYEIPDFRSRYMTIYDDSIYICDSWGERFNLVSNNTFPLATMGTNPNGCNDLTINLNWINWGGTDGNDFPHEFRNLGKLDNVIRFAMPQGYTYVDQSAKMFAYTPNEGGNNPRFFTDAQTMITPVFSANGDTLIFNETWPLVDKAGQAQITYGTPPVMSFQITPTCGRNDTVVALMDFKYTNYQYLESTEHQQHINWSETWHDDGNVPATNMRWYHYLPNLVVNPGLATVDAYANTVSWDLQICNQRDAQHQVITTAEGVWMDIDNLLSNEGNILISSIQEIGSNNSFNVSDYNNGTSTFVELGPISANVCRTYRINASYTNCSPDELDSIRVLTGWNCGAYPAPEAAEGASCQVDTSFFMIRYKTANLQMAVSEPFGTYEICDTLSYEVTLTSSEPANMYDVKLWTNLPEGAQIISAFYQYPETNTAWNSLAQSATTDFTGYNAYGWNLSGIVPQFTNGFLGSRFPNENEIRVRFEVVMDCSYNPNQELMIFVHGLSNCNDSVALNAHYSLPISGFENLVDYTLTHTIKDTLNCLSPNTISYTVGNPGSQPNTIGDSLRVQLPQGFVFVAESALPSQPVVSGNELTWAVGLIPANGTKTFSFRIEADNMIGCNEISLPAELFRTRSSNCSQVCDIRASWTDTLNTMFCCEACPSNAAFRTETVCAGEEMCFVSSAAMLSPEYTHNWSFGDGSYANTAEPCHVYAAAGNYTVTHVVRNSEGCTDTMRLVVTVNALADGTIQYIGNDIFCEGSTIQLTVNGVYTSVEWMTASGELLGSNDTLTVVTGGTYLAILRSGECAGKTLTMTLTQQALPQIELADTLVCSAGDLLVLDAGTGFGSYSWSTGAATQTITAAAGTYWVEVSSENGVCMAKDSVTIRINDLQVALQDTVMCAGSSITLNAVVSGGMSPYSYSWNSTAATQQFTATAFGNYSVTVSDAAGCTAAATMNLGMLQTGTADFILDETVCLLDTACFVAADTTAYQQWNLFNSNGSPFVSFGNYPEFCFQFPNAGTYTVEHIINNGCSKDTVSKIITVIPPVEACIVLIGSNPFCEGSTVYLTTNDPYNQVQQIDWYRNGVYVGTMDTLTVTQGGSYTAIVVDFNGCTNSCMCMVLTQTPAPRLKMSKQSYICSGGGNQVLHAQGPSSCQWFLNNTLVGMGNDLTVSQAGTYVVRAASGNGCTVTDSVVVQGRAIHNNLSASSETACVGYDVQLSASSDQYYSYQWQKFVAGAWVNLSGTGANFTTPVYKAGVNTFRVIIRDQLSGCEAMQTVQVEGSTKNCKPVTVSPNPTEKQKSAIYYSLSGLESKAGHLEIYSMRGELVMTQNIDLDAEKADLDFSGKAEGVYLVRLIVDGQEITTEKIMVLGW
ncbi:MAG: PKD domain-containing protein [Bacteroidota bacterium]